MYNSVKCRGISKIENLELEKENDKYYLNLSVILDSEYSINRLKSKVILPVNMKWIQILENNIKFCADYDQYGTFINLGFGELKCVDNKVEYELVCKKEHEMTLSEIERKLGYKIKLVSEKE